MIFIADFIACSTCFGHHYAHHQELESIIQMVTACGIWCFGFQVVGMVWSCFSQSKAAARKPDTQPSAPHHTDNLKTEAPNTTGSDHLYNTLELLMMGIMVPETCWASNKICNKNHLLHLVGILFPHIKDDARSESLQMDIPMFLISTELSLVNFNIRNPLVAMWFEVPTDDVVLGYGDVLLVLYCTRFRGPNCLRLQDSRRLRQ